MNTYVRQIRGILESLGLVRQSGGSWTGGFLIGTGVGAVAGAAVAALLVPTNGKEMRKVVRSKAKRLARNAEKQITAIKSPSPNGVRDHARA